MTVLTQQVSVLAEQTQWLEQAFPEVRDVQVRRARRSGLIVQVASGQFAGAMLAVVPTPGGDLAAVAMGVCPGCKTLVDIPGARPEVRVSRHTVQRLPVPYLQDAVAFYRAYGTCDPDAEDGPVTRAAAPCPDCAPYM